MKKQVVTGLVIAALAVVPAALADSSTVLDGYGSNAAKPVVQVKGTAPVVQPKATPVVQVKGTTESKGSTASGTPSSSPSTLPFTGSDLAIFMVAGVVLVGMGVGMRRLGRDKA